MRGTWSSDGGVDVTLTWRYIGGTQLFNSTNTTNQNFRLKTINYFDLATSFEVYEGITMRAGINNILGTRPALSNAVPAGLGTGNTYPGLYDVDMRHIFMGFTANF
jgi:outer membrane receptor protein involved in Fe transport